MIPSKTSDFLTRATLRAGIAIPFIYYGIQLIAALFNPGYSFIRQAASELGSDLSRHAGIFNIGIMAQGVLTLAVALAFFRALLRLRTHLLLAVLTSLALAMNGVQTLWAGYFPMPDPRHGGHPAFIIPMILLPFLLTFSMWKHTRPAGRAYFIASNILLLIMVPFMSGKIGIDTSQMRGLLQRIFTLALFPPIGAAAFVLARQVRASCPYPTPRPTA